MRWYTSKEHQRFLDRVVTIKEEEVTLTVREFDILFKLLSYPKKTAERIPWVDHTEEAARVLPEAPKALESSPTADHIRDSSAWTPEVVGS